jgi:eukaryotic-like serine/threonine-protein kinase
MTGTSPTRVIGGRYVVLGGLGRVDIGMVWRAADRVTGRQVAVVELHLPADPEERSRVRERLLRAARAAGRLDHPGLVAAYDVVTEGDVEHVVTELVDAPSLADRVTTGGPLDERTAAAMARQLAETLHAAHSAGVVHGDVNPRSILLPPDGQVRLAGAGVAEAVDPLRTTRDPAFLAPELRDDGKATPESDLWALGAALHVALLGRPPSDDVAPGSVGGTLGGVLAGLLQRVPEDRLTARNVTLALEAPPTLAGPAAGRGRRWRWAAAGAVLGLLVGLTAGFLLSGQRLPILMYGPGGDVGIAGPVAGVCLAAAPEPGVLVTAVDCAGPHAAEVVATLDPYGDLDLPFPGRDALDRFATGACTAAFEAMTEPSDRAGLEPMALVPAPAAFGTGDRDVYCLVRAADGSALTGSRVVGKRG